MCPDPHHSDPPPGHDPAEVNLTGQTTKGRATNGRMRLAVEISLAEWHDAMARGVSFSLPPEADGVALYLERPVPQPPAQTTQLLSWLERSDTDFPPVLAIGVSCKPSSMEETFASLCDLWPCSARNPVPLLILRLPGVDGFGPHGGLPRYQDVLNFGYALLSEFRFYAWPLGVRVVVEVCTDSAFLSPVEARELFDRVHAPFVGACVDLERVRRVGSPTDWVRTLGPYVQCVRMRRFHESTGLEADLARTETTGLSPSATAQAGASRRANERLSHVGDKNEVERGVLQALAEMRVQPLLLSDASGAANLKSLLLSTPASPALPTAGLS